MNDDHDHDDDHHQQALATAMIYGLRVESNARVRTFTNPDEVVFDADDVVALVGSSPSTHGLLGIADQDQEMKRASAFREAIRWLSSTCIPAAPPVAPEALRALAERGIASGYALIEPELRLRGRPAIDRAIHALIEGGALARAFLFVPSKSKEAKANGLIKLREDRALDGWIASNGRIPSSSDGDRVGIESTAFAILSERSATPIRGSELLRESRSRFGKTSTSDAMTIGKAIVHAWMNSEARIYADEPGR